MQVTPDEYDEEIHGAGPLPEHCGCRAWAWWNACQGIFACSVSWSRKGATKLADTYAPTGAILVPVRIFVEPEDEWQMRHWDADDMENGD
jgi:hypothetical protein